MAVHLDTKAVREVVKLPPQASGGQFALNCDETLLVGIGPDGKTIPRTPPPNGGGGTLEANWARGTPKLIFTINVRTGACKVIHRENDWTNHLQCSPTDPQQILFCHEGPWHFNDRTWTVRADDGQWIYLIHPAMVRGSSLRDKGDLIEIGYFKAGHLVNLARHNYRKETGVEPNLTFTPDGKWIIFRGNFDSPLVNGQRVTHVYAVALAKTDPPAARPGIMPQDCPAHTVRPAGT